MIKKEELGIDNLIIYQDSDLYRFTSDSVMLTRFASAKAGDVVADLCSGSGIVGLHFYALNSRAVKRVDLFELQTPLYSLSLKTVEENGLDGVIFPHNERVQDIGNDLSGKYSLCLCNPPYAKTGSGFKSDNESEIIAKTEEKITFDEIAKVAGRILKFHGRFCFVHRADRVAEIIYSLRTVGIEPKRMQFVTGSDLKTPYLVMIEGVKGGNSGVTVLPNLTNGDNK
ncbi:MAG: methyltransferase [Clostridia bacterium]|nr:methyltransferase [Clostridia bacterium]